MKTSRPSRFWLKMFFGCALVVAFIAIAVSLVASNPAETIEGQLQALRNRHIKEAYYQYTSKSFQDAVSLDHFRQFIDQYPAFTQSKSVRVISNDIENNVGSLEAALLTLHDLEFLVQYRLIKEGGKWKILSIKFEEDESDQPRVFAQEEHYKFGNAQIAMNQEPETQKSTLQKSASASEGLDMKAFTDGVQAQLVQIRQHHIEKAYEEYTAREFKQVTTLKEFNHFIKDHPGLSDNRSFDVGKLTLEENNVILSGTLISKSGSRYPVEYTLVFENDAWKVLHIEVVNQGKQWSKRKRTGKSPCSLKNLFWAPISTGMGLFPIPQRRLTKTLAISI